MPWDLYHHIALSLQHSEFDPSSYKLVFDWCCMASQPGTGTNTSSSMLAFATPAVLGMSPHLHEWVYKRLLSTLGPTADPRQGGDGTNEPNSNSTSREPAPPRGTVEVTLIALVTAAMVAALQAEKGILAPSTEPRAKGRQDAVAKPYSNFQLAKLKGFSCVRNKALLQPIWQYFHSTKEVDTQCTQLLEEMRAWARKNNVHINRSIYFDKALMDDFTKMEFGLGTATAYLNTAEQGVSILVCRPRAGNQIADLRSKEQAMSSTQQNHTLAEARLLVSITLHFNGCTSWSYSSCNLSGLISGEHT